MNSAQFSSYLRDQVGDDTQAVFAKRLGISPQHLSDMLAGRRDPGERVLDALGLVRDVRYLSKAGAGQAVGTIIHMVCFAAIDPSENGKWREATEQIYLGFPDEYRRILYTAVPAAVAQEPVARVISIDSGTWAVVEMIGDGPALTLRQKLYAAPPAAQAGVMKNAERYLVLRDKETGIQAMTGNNGQWGECGHRELYGEELDSAIDAALTAAKGDLAQKGEACS